MGTEHVDGKNRGNVMLFALSTCGWCAKTKDLLRQLGIAFDYTFVDLLDGKDQEKAGCARCGSLLMATRPERPHGFTIAA